MATKRTRPKAQKILVRIPHWVAGGNPAQLAELCDWEIESADHPDYWLIRNKEAQYGTSPKFLEITKMVDRKNAHQESAYGRIRRLKVYDHLLRPELWSIAQEAYKKLSTKELEDESSFLTAMHILISAAPSASAAAEVTQKVFIEYMLEATDNPTLYMIENSVQLSYRYSAARMLLSTKNIEDKEVVETEKLISRSSKGLFSDTTLGLDAYLSCLCACLSPDIWAMPVGRMGGVVLIIFGRTVSGQSTTIQDKIQHLAPVGALLPSNMPCPEDSAVFEKVAKWWVDQLDVMFSILTEPANYYFKGEYDAAQATEKLLTLEQIFRDCQSVLTHPRDLHARTVLAFTLLKRLEGVIPGHTWKRVVGRSSLESIVEQLKRDVPAELHCVLMPKVDQALAAVCDIENGFFASGDGTDKILLPNKEDVLIQVERRAAVTEWLQLIRNSLHGFNKPTPRDRALLAAHDGEIPPTFADIVWIHILDIVTHPEKLGRFDKGRKLSK